MRDLRPFDALRLGEVLEGDEPIITNLSPEEEALYCMGGAYDGLVAVSFRLLTLDVLVR
jgi:hypothetical protein